MKHLILLMLTMFLITPNLKSEEQWYFTFGGWSYHTMAQDYKFDFKRTRNETHNPIGFEYEVDQKKTVYSFEVITFKNSHYMQSNALCSSYLFKYKYGNIGGKACFSTGYEEKVFILGGKERMINEGESEYVFYILPVYSFMIRSFKFELAYAPKGDGNESSTDVFMLISKIII